jgi:hypothetical protein
MLGCISSNVHTPFLYFQLGLLTWFLRNEIFIGRKYFSGKIVKFSPGVHPLLVRVINGLKAFEYVADLFALDSDMKVIRFGIYKTLKTDILFGKDMI